MLSSTFCPCLLDGLWIYPGVLTGLLVSFITVPCLEVSGGLVAILTLFIPCERTSWWGGLSCAGILLGFQLIPACEGALILLVPAVAVVKCSLSLGCQWTTTTDLCTKYFSIWVVCLGSLFLTVPAFSWAREQHRMETHLNVGLQGLYNRTSGQHSEMPYLLVLLCFLWPFQCFEALFDQYMLGSSTHLFSLCGFVCWSSWWWLNLTSFLMIPRSSRRNRLNYWNSTCCIPSKIDYHG